ncbi:TetR/AcrR family transcriptional regulator [Crossiella sp. CA198]|uniref:TetR/AcrR family transcriptional regulator n=1 Tax=Crossiella sp. CA198 TaxID=3455607 RepID=UPI003F8CF74D
MAEQDETARRRGRGARERILAAAMALFETQGITATGMEQVASHAPVSKRTLYLHFPTKDQLVVAYLRHLAESGHTIDHALDRADLSPRQRLLELFTVPRTGTGPIRGCPFIDAAAEFPDPDSPVHAHTRQEKQRFTHRVIELVRQLGAAHPEILGEQLAILADGVASRAMVFNDPGCGEHARAAAAALLDAATGSPSTKDR